MSTVTPPFKVLIAGGSISGLTLALALEHAGIDYELFEKGDIDNDLGASIAVNASSNRILDQLGVYESIEPIVTGLIRSYRIDGKTGHTILDKNFYQGIQDEYV
jgi:2-polyprenyl-6-methoxyphenol hydroxylase-like FAD-dependent oxidoreductase